MQLTRNGIIFIGGFPPSIARLAEYNYEVVSSLAEKLASCGVRIIVLANKPDIFTTKSEIKLPTNAEVLYFWHAATTLSLPLKLIQLRRIGNILIISFYHGIFGRSSVANFLSTLSTLVTAKILRYKTITILHTLPGLREDVFKYFTEILNYVYRLGTRIITLLILNLSHRVLLLVRAYREILLGSSPSLRFKIYYIPHGVPIYVRYNSKKLCCKDSITIAFIGLISPRKNLVSLVGALNKLRSSLNNSRVRLVLIGAPHPYLLDESFLLIRQIANNYIDVKYLGYLETKELQDYIYKNTDMVILPYDAPTGTSGVAHITAPAATPIIMPSFIEYIELYKDGHGLKLYNAYSDDISTELVKSIYEILVNPLKYEELCRRASSYAKKYSIAKTAIALLKHLIELWKK